MEDPTPTNPIEMLTQQKQPCRFVAATSLEVALGQHLLIIEGADASHEVKCHNSEGYICHIGKDSIIHQSGPNKVTITDINYIIIKSDEWMGRYIHVAAAAVTTAKFIVEFLEDRLALLVHRPMGSWP